MRFLRCRFFKAFLTVAQPYWCPTTLFGRYLFPILWLVSPFVSILLFAWLIVVIAHLRSPLSGFLQQQIPELTQAIDQLTASLPTYSFAGVISITFLLIWLFWSRMRRFWWQWLCLLILFLLLLLVNSTDVVISYVSRDLINALSQREAARVYSLLWIYAGLFSAIAVLTALSQYAKKILGLNWYKWLTHYFLNQYFNDRAYYHLHAHGTIDNPDQRIAQEIEVFIHESLGILVVTFNQLVNLIVFVGVLWFISKLLVVVLIACSLAGNLLIMLFSRKLVHLNSKQFQIEADFRYSLVHVRNHSESIALYNGEAKELQTIHQRFQGLTDNTQRLIDWQRNLEILANGYRYFLLVLPYLVVSPLYLKHQIELGVLIQTSIACAQVSDALSIMINQFESLGTLMATTHRLAVFWQALQSVRYVSTGIERFQQNDLTMQELTIKTPDLQRVLIQKLSISAPSSGLLITGASGCGKSSLLKTISGLWNFGEGYISHPNPTKMLFLPQRPYMTLGSLRDQIVYPRTHTYVATETLEKILHLVNLSELPNRVGGFDTELDWEQVLSLGEQQRLAFARLFLFHPQYAILDEATSALDVENEERLYRQLQKTDIAFISIGHRSSLFKYHQQVLKLSTNATWKLT